MIPYLFVGIQLRRVCWKKDKLDVSFLLFDKRLGDFAVVVACIVCNYEDRLVCVLVQFFRKAINFVELILPSMKR